MKAPCKNCPDREIGCHASCPDYIAFRQYKDEENFRYNAKKRDEWLYKSERRTAFAKMKKNRHAPGKE